MKKILIGLLMLGFAKSILLAYLIPPWKAEDELHHWGYADALWRNNAVLLTEEQEYLSQGGLDFYYATAARTLVGTELDTSNQLNSTKRLEVSQMHLTTTYQPPLYYLPIAIVWKTVGGQDILSHLYWARATSAVWYTTMLVGLWSLVGLLKVRKKYQILTVIVAMGWPQLSYLGAVVNPHIAEICLFTWGTVALIKALRSKFDLLNSLEVGLIMAGLMMIKHTAIVYGLMVGVSMISGRIRNLKGWKNFIYGAVTIGAIGALSLYPYYLINQSNVYINEVKDLPTVDFATYLLNQWSYQKDWIWQAMWEVNLSSTFGAGGAWLAIAKILSVATVIGLLIYVKEKKWKVDDDLILISLVGIIGLTGLLLYWGYMRFNLAGEQWIKGRYFLSMLPAFVILARIGIAKLTFLKNSRAFELMLVIWSVSYLLVSYADLLVKFYILNQL